MFEGRIEHWEHELEGRVHVPVLHELELPVAALQGFPHLLSLQRALAELVGDEPARELHRFLPDGLGSFQPDQHLAEDLDDIDLQRPGGLGPGRPGGLRLFFGGALEAGLEMQAGEVEQPPPTSVGPRLRAHDLGDALRRVPR